MCVTKIHHVVILHILKIYLSKNQGKFKFKSGKSGKSRGIFVADMAQNPACCGSGTSLALYHQVIICGGWPLVLQVNETYAPASSTLLLGDALIAGKIASIIRGAIACFSSNLLLSTHW